MELSREVRSRARKQIEAYFERCRKEGRRCTLPGLKVALEAGEAQWSRLCADRLLRRELELAVARIQDEVEQEGGQRIATARHQALTQATREAGGGTGRGLWAQFDGCSGKEEFGG